MWNSLTSKNPSVISDIFQIKIYDPISGDQLKISNFRHAYEIQIPIPPYFTQFKVHNRLQNVYSNNY